MPESSEELKKQNAELKSKVNYDVLLISCVGKLLNAIDTNDSNGFNIRLNGLRILTGWHKKEATEPKATNGTGGKG